MNNHFYAVIMAGGGGTRLWPISRQATPKQTLKLIGDKSLFRITIDRLDGLFAPEQIFVVTVIDQVDALRSQAPEIPAENFLVEPMPRGTASVVAMAAAAIQKIDSLAIIAILTADHFIPNVKEFQKTLIAAMELAKQEYLVTLGIHPTHASSGYGYIESGSEIGTFNELKAFNLKRFIEKPDELRARELIKEKSMNWNSGMFIWRADTILGEFKKYMPELVQAIEMLTPMVGIDHSSDKFIEAWRGIQPQTIDYGIMEKSSRCAVIPAQDLGWNDVGSWDSLFDVIDSDANGNIILGSSHIGFETDGSLIYSSSMDKMIVTMGMKNIIVVNTDDAVLICPRGESQKVRDLVNFLKENHYKPFL